MNLLKNPKGLVYCETIPVPPKGYRMMDGNENPNKGDLVVRNFEGEQWVETCFTGNLTVTELQPKPPKFFRFNPVPPHIKYFYATKIVLS